MDAQSASDQAKEGSKRTKVTGVKSNLLSFPPHNPDQMLLLNLITRTIELSAREMERERTFTNKQSNSEHDKKRERG